MSNPLGTATVVKLDPSKVGQLPAAYCEALREFDVRYGPVYKPQITVESFPDALKLFKTMHAEAPPEIKKRLEEPIQIGDKLQAAIDNGQITDDQTALDWAERNLGKEGLQKFLAQMVTIVYYSIPECRIGGG